MVSMNMERKWVFPVAVSLFVAILLLLSSNAVSIFPVRVTTNLRRPAFVETRIPLSLSPPLKSLVPRFAYLVSGSKGDLEKLWRTLQALYHPWNYYVVHLDLESPLEERLELASRVENNPTFSMVGNVYMITKANMVTYRGPTMVANTLHACAILLKRSKNWDWFINLSASDYPLVTQDDLLHTFSRLNRSFNFIEHTSQLGWKAGQRGMPLMVDPGLYLSTKSDIFWASPKRSLPTAFKLFTGSAWMMLSRSFVEYTVLGWDNLPRTLLMYYTNFVSSPEGYFQTVICNAEEFVPTVINHDMHYISWDNPPKQHPHILCMNDTSKMIKSNAAFARKFSQDNPVLDQIDRDLLNRKKDGFTPGAWCSGDPTCSKVGNPSMIRPGPGAKRLRRLIKRLIWNAKQGDQCK